MSNDLHRMIYVSAARVEMSPEELDSILEVSRRNNAAAGVTGLLLYHDGSFFQVLEGPKDAVVRTFSRIELDHRHSRVIVLQTKTTETRGFPNWSMGYMKAQALRPEQKAHLFDLRQMVGQEDAPSLSSSPLISVHINAFLGSFREFAEV